MPVIIVWIIVIVWIVVALNRNQKKMRRMRTSVKSAALQRTPGKPVARQLTVEQQMRKPQHIDLAVEKMTSAAIMNGQRAGYERPRYNIPNKERETEESFGDVIKEIEDLMIKGPDTGITFERDFLAEGLDMLNQIQV